MKALLGTIILLLIFLTACTSSGDKLPAATATATQISTGLIKVSCSQIAIVPSTSMISNECVTASGRVYTLHVDVIQVPIASDLQTSQPTEPALDLENIDLMNFILDDGQGHSIAKLVSDSASVNISRYAAGKWVTVTGYLLDDSHCKYSGNLPCIQILSIEEKASDSATGQH